MRLTVEYFYSFNDLRFFKRTGTEENVKKIVT